ncbi:hypothetical protein BG004_002634 [Podila humilis]|nr:hypothetical protein BG004_002634 [Podila humilis]
MQFSARSISAAVFLTLTLVVSSSNASACYKQCIVDGGSATYCKHACVDQSCFDACRRQGEREADCLIWCQI